jgi:hypothetical protein
MKLLYVALEYEVFAWCIKIISVNRSWCMPFEFNISFTWTFLIPHFEAELERNGDETYAASDLSE